MPEVSTTPRTSDVGNEAPPVIPEPPVMAVAGHRLQVFGDLVHLDDRTVRLSAAPAAVLEALVRRPGHVVARATLLAALPSGTAASEHAVEVAVARLRQRLGPEVVQTSFKRGYRLAVS